MNLQNFDKVLAEYNNRLEAIVTENINYNALNSAVLIFFKEINSDKNFLEYYFINITKENVNGNFVQKYAFSYFVLLTIKNTSKGDFFARFFPEYVELASEPRSNWRVVRWLQIFIAWIIKPKPKLSNFADAKTILNALRDIKHRIKNTKNELLDVKLEMESYKSLDSIAKKIIEPKTSPLIYISINEEQLIRDWLISYVQKLESVGYSKQFLEGYSEAYSEIDTLLKYLKYRIKPLLDSDEKTKLLNKFIKLQDFTFKKEFSLFEGKIYEIKEFIKSKSNYKNVVKMGGIYNLLEGIKLRFKIMCEVNDEMNLADNHQSHLTSNFKQLLGLRMDKIRFFYEAYRKNLDQQVELCCGNISKLYEILNKLESILYIDKNLFFYSSNQSYSRRDFANLAASLEKILMLAKDLENCAKAMDPKPLENDVHQLYQSILAEISFLHTKLEKEVEENLPPADYESDGWDDSEWDEESNISENPDADQFEQKEVSNRASVYITNEDIQSDSGISEYEVEVRNSSGKPRILAEASSAFFVRSNDQDENSNRTRSSFRHSYHG